MLALLDPLVYYQTHQWLNWLFGGSLLMGVVGYLVANTKGNGCWGCGLGCLLGPLGVLIAMLIPERNRL